MATLVHVEVAHVVEAPFAVPAGFDEDGFEVVRWVDRSGVFVAGVDADGRVYHHLAGHFEDEAAADRLVARVRAAGLVIDEAHWAVEVPYGSAAWDIDGMEVTLMDDEERYHRGL